MDAELVGAAGEGIEGEEGVGGGAIEDFVVGDGGFAELEVDDLAGTIVGIDGEGQGDDAALAGKMAIETGEVALADGLLLELLLEELVGLGILGSEHQAAGGLVETMDEHRTMDRGIALVEPRFDRGKGEVLGGCAEDVLGLDEAEEVFVLVDDGEGVDRWTGSGFGSRSQRQHVGEDGRTLLDTRRIRTAMDAQDVARRTSVPELDELEGTEVMLVGILQEARSRAFATTTGREATTGVGEDVDDIAIAELGVAEVEVTEDLALQFDTHGTTLGSEFVDLTTEGASGQFVLRLDGREGVDAMVEGGDVGIATEVEVVGILQVVDRRDEEIVRIAEIVHNATVGSKVGNIIKIMYARNSGLRKGLRRDADEQDAEHLALFEQRSQLRMGIEV